MKKIGLFQHRFILLFSLLLVLAIGFGLTFSSCSSSKHYGQTQHKCSQYRNVRVKQPRWNTATSTSTTYYIKKQKPRKRYNP